MSVIDSQVTKSKSGVSSTVTYSLYSLVLQFQNSKNSFVAREQTHVDVREGGGDTAPTVHVTSEDRWESKREENQEPIKNVSHIGRIVLIRNVTFWGDTKWVKALNIWKWKEGGLQVVRVQQSTQKSNYNVHLKLYNVITNITLINLI